VEDGCEGGKVKVRLAESGGRECERADKVKDGNKSGMVKWRMAVRTDR
jgi:hypothetical protein